MNLLKKYGFIQFFRFACSELYSRIWKYNVLGSYSQCGEDVALDQLLGSKANGFYIDIGAYDPYRFSNTMRFYKRGWRGINIEPDVQRHSHFLRKRKGDINLNIGIANKRGKLTYYVLSPATLSTFNAMQAKRYVRDGFTIIETKQVPVLPLKEVLTKYAFNKQIDFLSLDVEGFELESLKSNDWMLFRPTILCVETAVGGKEEIDGYLLSKNYHPIYDNGLNTFYRDND